MEEEIKEILDKPKILMLSYGNYISLDDYVKLKDYITNLQEETERQSKAQVILDNQIAEMFKYKQINEKATEYIIDNCVLSDEWKDLGFCNFIPTGRIEYKQLSKTKIKYLLKILKGDKDE